MSKKATKSIPIGTLQIVTNGLTFIIERRVRERGPWWFMVDSWDNIGNPLDRTPWSSFKTLKEAQLYMAIIQKADSLRVDWHTVELVEPTVNYPPTP